MDVSLMLKVLLVLMDFLLFYQHFWNLVKHDLLMMFNDWNKDELDLFRLNFSLLTLIPKEADAVTI
jgi:hypothetical protein